MKILITAWHYPKVSESFIHEPAGWLQESGHRVRIVSEEAGELRPGDSVAVPGRALGRRIPEGQRLLLAARRPVRAVTRLAAARRWRGVLSTREILARALLPEVAETDVILAHFGPVAMRWLGVAGTAGRPMAAFFHGYDATRVLAQDPRRYDRLFRSGVPLLVNSQYLGGRLESAGAPKDRIFVVPLAASEAFGGGTDVGRRERSITTVGRLVEKKGIDDALRAFALAQDVLQGRWTYEILGDGSLKPSLSSLADELGVGGLVAFRGSSSREAVRSSLQRSRIFLLLSRTAENGDTEGTPIAIMEAGMARIPIVTTHHAGIPEMVPADGPDLGFVVEEGDVAAAADALRSLATDEEKGTEWGTRCRDHIEAKYGERAHVARLIEVLESQARVPA